MEETTTTEFGKCLGVIWFCPTYKPSVAGYRSAPPNRK